MEYCAEVNLQVAKRAFYILVMLAILGCCLPVLKTKVAEAAVERAIPFVHAGGRVLWNGNTYWHPGTGMLEPNVIGGTEAKNSFIMPCAGTWKHLLAAINTAVPAGCTRSLDFHVNAISQFSVTWIAGESGNKTNLVGEAAVVAGDEVCIHGSSTGGWGGGASTVWRTSLLFVPTDDVIPFIGSIWSDTGAGHDNISWSALYGESTPGTIHGGVEYQAQCVVPVAGKFKYAYVSQRDGLTGVGETCNVTFRKNGLDTGIAFVWNGTSEDKEDLATEVTAVAGDMVNFQIYSSTKTTLILHSICFIPDDPNQWWISRPCSDVLLTNGAATYSHPTLGDIAGSTAWNAVEPSSPFPEGVQIEAIAIGLTTAPGLGSTRTITLREGGVNTTITVSISGLSKFAIGGSGTVYPSDFDMFSLSNTAGGANSYGSVALVGSYIVPPTVVTLAATSITVTSAIISGNVTDLGSPSDNCDLWGLEWGLASGTYTDNWEDTGSMGTGVVFSTTVTGCIEGFTYFYRAFARNPTSGYGYGLELSFTTTWECTMYENITTQEDSVSESIGGSDWSFQSVTATDNHYVNFVYLLMYRVNTPTNLHVYFCDEDNTTHLPVLGDPLSEGTLDVSTITNAVTGEWLEIYLDESASVIAGENYSLVVSQEQVGANDVMWLTSTTAGTGEYYHSHDAGATWTTSVRDAMFALAECPIPLAPAGLHIIAIEAQALTFAWQEIAISNSDYVLVYRTDNFPVLHTAGTEAYRGSYTTARVDELDCGVTYYFGVWSYASGVYSLTPYYCAATTSAGWGPPEYTDVGDTTDSSILGNSPIGDFIDFISQYGQLPQKTVGLLGYSSIFVFALMGVAVYNRSVMVTIVTALVGLALGIELGVFALVFLVISLIVGVAVGTIRGGQPSGG